MAGNEVKFIFGANTNDFQKGTKIVNTELAKVATSSKQAGQSVLNFSRIVQDAPFAFRNFGSIANNIDPLFESMRRLREEAKLLSIETGKTVTPFQLLKQSLAGGAGIGLAISAATSLLTAFTIGLFGSGKAADQAKKKADEYRESINQIISDLAKEQNKVQTLVEFIKLETTSRAQRIAAIKQLQNIAPAYFSTLNAEKATVNEVSKAYALFAGNIQNTIKARIFEKELLGITERRLKLEEELNRSNTEQVVINGKLVRVRNFSINQDKTRQQKQDEYLTLLRTEEQLIKRINELKPPELKLDNNKKDKIKKEIKALFGSDVTLKSLDETIFGPDEGRFGFDGRVKALEKLFKGGASTQFIKDLQAQTKPLLDAMAAIEQKGLAIADVLVNNLGSAFTTLFSDIQSGSKSAFADFGQAIAGVIKKLIAAAITAALFAAIIGAVTGGGSFGQAAGTAKNFLSGFKNLFSQLGGFKFAEGGIVTGPTLGLVGEAGPEAVIPLSKLASVLGSVGGPQVVINGRLSIGFDELSLALERNDARRSRLG